MGTGIAEYDKNMRFMKCKDIKKKRLFHQLNNKRIYIFQQQINERHILLRYD